MLKPRHRKLFIWFIKTKDEYYMSSKSTGKSLNTGLGFSSCTSDCFLRRNFLDIDDRFTFEIAKKVTDLKVRN